MNLTAEDVAWILQIALIAWLSALAGFVFYAVLLRGRGLVEMLTDDSNRRIAPERVTELFIILLIAGYYVLNGGSADIETQPTRKTKLVTGIRWISPPNLSISRSPVAVSTAPAPMKSRLLNSAWLKT